LGSAQCRRKRKGTPKERSSYYLPKRLSLRIGGWDETFSTQQKIWKGNAHLLFLLRKKRRGGGLGTARRQTAALPARRRKPPSTGETGGPPPFCDTTSSPGEEGNWNFAWARKMLVESRKN